MFDRRKKKNREKNFSFRRFFLNPMLFSCYCEGCGVIPSGGPEDRSRGIGLCQQTSRLPLEVTWRMAREAGPSAALRTTRVLRTAKNAPEDKKECAPKGGISRLTKMRKPQCTGVHEDFRIKRNAEITLLGHTLQKNETYCDFTDNPAWQPRAGHKDRLYLHLSLHNHCMRTSKSPSSPEKCSDIYA